MNVRVFSSIFDRNSQAYIRSEQINEVENIKERMATYKINIPTKQLMESTVIPEYIYGDKLNNLPKVGMGLLTNPLFAVGKKKKKKKN